MSLPRSATRDEWLAARLDLLSKEKDLTRQRDALNVERRNLPMVEIEKDYTFDGPNGTVGLIDLFEDRPQLIIYHSMFDPGWAAGCPSTTAGTVYFLALTARGRQEDWEEPKGRSGSARSARPDFAS